MDEENSKQNIINMDENVEESMLPKIQNFDRETLDNTVEIETDNALNKMTKVGVFRNLLVVSVTFMFLFSAYNSFVYLQSSLNKDDGLGTTGVALVNVSMALSALFLAPLTLSRFSDKRIIVVSIVAYILFVATGFYPTWATIIPASILVGMAGAHLWLAVQTYITDIAKHYANTTNTNTQDRLHLFLGIFYAFAYTSNIWGNLFSSLAFQRTSPDNSTNKHLDICGPNFCPYKEMNDSIIVSPTKVQIYTYTGFCSGICFLALLLTLFFATDITSRKRNLRSVWKRLRLVTLHLFTSRNQSLLLFASLFGGLAHGFTAGDFTSAYISCPYGIEHVGFVMMVFGVCQSLSSIIFGKLNQYFGHVPIYIFGYIAQLAAYITLLLWDPGSFDYAVVYVISAVFGLGGAINTPLISGLYNLYFDTDREVAISSFRVLNSLGWAVAFGYSSWLCTQYKIYVLICVLTLALVTIIALHVLYKREEKNEDSKRNMLLYAGRNRRTITS